MSNTATSQAKLRDRASAGWSNQIIRKSPRVKGRYMLSNGEEYPCEARCLSESGAELIAPKAGSSGEWIVCYLENIGIVPGRVCQPTRDGFAITIHVPEERRSRIAARVEWLTSRAFEEAEKRNSPRIVPKNTDVDVEITEGLTLPGKVVDISLSGAAIALDPRQRPKLGAVVRVGSRYSVVTRLTDDGIAVQFKLPFSSESFNEHVKL